jgi:hypothetical protein
MAGMAQNFISAFNSGTTAGRDARRYDTLSQYAGPAAQGDQDALAKIYGADPDAGMALENHFGQRTKQQAEWDDYIQQHVEDVANGVQMADPSTKAQKLLQGADFLEGLVKRDPRFAQGFGPQLQNLRQVAASNDPQVIDAALKPILANAVHYRERQKLSIAAGAKDSDDEQMWTTLTDPKVDPNSPEYQRAYLRLQTKYAQDKYQTTPNGTMYIPGKIPEGIRTPNGMGGGQPAPAAPPGAARAPATLGDYAAQPGGQGAPAASAPNPAGPYIIPGTEKQLQPAAVKVLKDQREVVRSIGSNIQGAKDWIAAIDQGKFDPGVMSNLYADWVQNNGGTTSEFSRDLVSLRAYLSNLSNEKLRQQVGPQTEGDAIRIRDELLNNLKDPALIKQRLSELVNLFEQGQANAYDELGQIAQSYGTEPEPLEELLKNIKPVYGPAVRNAKPEPAAAADGPPAPLGAYAAGKGSAPPPPSEKLGPFLRADVEAFAKANNVTLEYAYQKLTERLNAKMQAQSKGQK